MDTLGRNVYTGSADFTCKIWNLENGKELHTLKHSHVIKTCSVSQSNNQLLTGGMDKIVHLYDIETCEVKNKILHETAIAKTAWQNDNTIITASGNKLAKFDIREPLIKPIKEVIISSSDTIKCKDLEILFDGSNNNNNMVACAGKKIIILNEELNVVNSILVNFDVECASINQKSRFLVAGGSDLHAHVFENDGDEYKEIKVLKGHHGPIFCCRWDPMQPTRFATGSEDGTIRLWAV